MRATIIAVAPAVWLAAAVAGRASAVALPRPGPETFLSPTALAASADGGTLYVACATANAVVELDAASRRVRRVMRVPDPLGLALDADGKRLYVACAAPASRIAVIDTTKGGVTRVFAAGHTAMAPVLSPDGGTLYVCDRFNDEVVFLDSRSGRTRRRVTVAREPVAAALTPDGRLLFVANHLHAGRSDAETVAASVSVIDTAAGRLAGEIALPNGSGLLRGVAVSPDGRYACVTHLLSRFHLPTTQVERGWINSAALTLIDARSRAALNTVLLDNIDRGAANPWAVAWSADGATIAVTHAGTHELSVIDAPGLLKKLAALPAAPAGDSTRADAASRRVGADVSSDLSFLVGLRRRVPLARGDYGPRAVLLAGARAVVANYFSDTLSFVDASVDPPAVTSVRLGSGCGTPDWRRGEFYFNDASICFQGWQSCASCHSSDARVDGLNWDNLNDGIGNPKNAKSLLFAHLTPPSMWLGVRSNAAAAVRAGIRNSLFTVQPAEVAEAMDAYLKSLKPIPSPRLVRGRLSPRAERGRNLFFSDAVGCGDCHKGALFTDGKVHDVGTAGRFDRAGDRFDTPSLVEVWRSAPYLHDGSASTVRDVLTTCNPADRHGSVRPLTRDEVDDLVEYVLSL